MGYANLIPYNAIRIGSPNINHFDINAVAADVTFNQAFTLPNYLVELIKYCYVVAVFPKQQDTSGAQNSLHGCTIQASTDAGATYHDAITFTGQWGRVGANEVSYQHIEEIGDVDIAQYGIVAGTTISFQFHNVHAEGANLKLDNVKLYLDVVLR